MGKIAKGVNKVHFTMLYHNYCYIFIENFRQKFSPCAVLATMVTDHSDKLFSVVRFDIGDAIKFLQ